MIPDAVERAACLGWVVYPRLPHHRAAAFGGAAAQATSDLTTIERWCSVHPGCGWYAVTGQSGIWALDIDAPPKADGVSAMRRLTDQRGPLPAAPTIRTGGGGWCVVFRHAGELIRGQPGALAAGIDARRGAQTITLPPTLHHATGRPYRWVTPPWLLSPPPAPAWLLTALRPPPEPAYRTEPADLSDRGVEVAIYRALDRVTAAGEGQRNATLSRSSYRIAMLASAGRIARRDAERLLIEAGHRIGLPLPEVRATVASAFRSAR